MSNKREIGNFGEEKAAELLAAKKYKILERNFRSQYGEIDIIAKHSGCIVFVEVKLRNTSEFGSGAEQVNKQKQKRIIQAALTYLKKNNLKNKDIRFDVVLVSPENTEHIESAFTSSGHYTY